MLTENVLNAVLRFVVGVKSLFVNHSTLANLLIPILFAVFWSIICTIAVNTDGDYDAPMGLLYMQ